ncbi:MAG: formyltransferase [Burkholderiales bacterium]|nr:formyltransferase [Burkholderiales bacterium]
MTSAVVFAYHDVGVRCLSVLLDRGVDVRLVVTHDDDPSESIWFASVAALARARGIPVAAPRDPNAPEFVARVAAAAPDFLFSFYYRHMLSRALLVIPTRGAYNMHGSLLPRYRGRVPINWAIIHGETETGATLHAMTEKPDNGAIVVQKAVPIGPDDTAREVFERVTAAAGEALDAALPALVAGTAPHFAQDRALASYFGGRRPEDGRIDFAWPARRIHDFVRALTRPYPGAFAEVGGTRLNFWRTRRTAGAAPPRAAAVLGVADGAILLECRDGGTLEVTDLEIGGRAVQAGDFAAAAGGSRIVLA